MGKTSNSDAISPKLPGIVPDELTDLVGRNIDAYAYFAESLPETYRSRRV